MSQPSHYALRIDKKINTNIKDAFDLFYLFRNRFKELDSEIDALFGQYGRLEVSYDEIKVNKIQSAFKIFLDRFKDELPKYLEINQPESFLSGATNRIEAIKEVIEKRLHREYKVINEIKGGNSATLFLLNSISSYNNKVVVANVLKMAEVSNEVEEEVNKVTELEHQNIIHIKKAYLDTYPFIILCQHIRGVPLAHGIDNTCPRPPRQAASWLAELAKTLEFLRQNEIRHLNVRPSKIYICERDHLVISPFDAIISGSDDRTFSRFMDDCLYFAPELLKGGVNPYALPKSELDMADRFSLGLIAYKILTGKDLFRNEANYGGNYDGADAIQDIFINRMKFFKSEAFRAERLAVLPSQKLADLILSALNPKPADRPPLKDISDSFEDIRLDCEKAYFNDPVRRSFQYCIENNPNFARDFYNNFFNKDLAKKTDIKERNKMLEGEQSRMLELAMEILLDLDNNMPHLYARIGDKRHRSFPPELYAIFFDSLIETVQENDPKASVGETAEAWKRLQQKSLAAIQQVLTKVNAC